jgi:glycosyl transferase, family 25
MHPKIQTFFSLLNIYFDKIYVITLARATERHEHVMKELQGLEYELFFGVDKQNFDIKELKQKGIYDEEKARDNHRYSKPLQPGMIGCSWSHRNIYTDIIENNYKNALVLEDDIIIDCSSIEYFEKVMKEVPQNWELLYLGYARNEEKKAFSFFKQLTYHIQRSIGKLKFSHLTIKNLYPKQVSDHIFQAGYHDHTHAYGITTSGARKLKELQEPISFIADHLLAYAATNEIVKAYIIKPKMINQLSQGELKQIGTYIHD